MRHLMRPMMDMPQTSKNSIDDVSVPIYEMIVNANDPDPDGLTDTKKADVSSGTPLHIRCSSASSGVGTEQQTADLNLLHNGNFLQENGDFVLEKSERRRISLKVASFSEKWSGTYECSLRSKEGKVRKSRLTLQPKAEAYNATLFGEEPCAPEISGQCLNGGICYRNPVINTFSCKCPLAFSGPTCAYHNSPDVIMANSIVETPQTCLNLFVYGCVFGVVFSAMLIAILLFFRNKLDGKLKQRKSFDSFSSKKASSLSGSYLPRQLSCTTATSVAAAADHYQPASEHEILLHLANTPAGSVGHLPGLLGNDEMFTGRIGHQQMSSAASKEVLMTKQAPTSQDRPSRPRQRKDAFRAAEEASMDKNNGIIKEEEGCYQNLAQVISRNSSSHNLQGYASLSTKPQHVVSRLSETSYNESDYSRSSLGTESSSDTAVHYGDSVLVHPTLA